MKFKRAQVKIATFERGQRVLDQSVNALVLGDLAVHKPLQGGGFCVTHIPSGFKMAEARKRRSCQELVMRLHTLGMDWNFDATAPPESYYEKASPILREFNSRVDR